MIGGRGLRVHRRQAQAGGGVECKGPGCREREPLDSDTAIRDMRGACKTLKTFSS